MSENKNPYEDASPIHVMGSSSHRRAQHSSSNPRSRSVQSARDSARNQAHMAPSANGASTADNANEQASAASRGARPSRRQSSSSLSETGSARGFTPASSSAGGRRPPLQSGRVYRVQSRRKRQFGLIVAIIVGAILVLSGLLWWINRPVPITVNGNTAEVRVGSTLQEVIAAEKIGVNPGDLVSVTDRVLEADMGYAFTATLNGQKLSPEDADNYKVRGNESIDFSDGENKIEEFTADSEEIKPYLRMEGSGYSIQYISQWGYSGERQHRVGKTSGETADVVTKEPQDCVITCLEPSIQGDKQYVALTFDDGPADPYTQQYLDILREHNVKATFFNLGENTEHYPELARKVVEEGHQLCNHTMAHNQLTAVDSATVYNEITRSESAIEKVTGVHTTHIRPPYGDFTERSWLGSGGSITAAIRWNGDSEDWRTPGVEAIVNNSLKTLHSGTIILMHDGGGDRNQDVEALPQLIERVQSEGYEFVTISELMRACGNIPEDICSGTANMPEGAVWPEEIHPDDIAAAAAASS